MVFVLSDKNECVKIPDKDECFSQTYDGFAESLFTHTSVSVVWLPVQIAVHTVSASMTDGTAPLLFSSCFLSSI